MKLLSNKRIQKLVDERTSASLLPRCSLVAPAASLVDVKGPAAYAKGVQDAVELCRKCTTVKTKLGRQSDFGIYVATQDTSDGKDAFYFIGTVESVCKRIEAA